MVLKLKKDLVEAMRLYRLAILQGNAYAQSNLGHCYQNGYGVEQDSKEAVRLHYLASNQGDADAQTHLGWHYENGMGVEKDLKKKRLNFIN